MKKLLLVSVLFMGFVLLFSEIPTKINFQGVLFDFNNQPVTGSYDITFKIYDSEMGGLVLWQETQLAVQIQQGLFNVVLGVIDPLTPALFKNTPLWLTFRVSGEVDEMFPRKQLLTVPFSSISYQSDVATYSDTAFTVAGIEPWQIVQKDNSDNISINGSMTATSFIGDGSALTGIPQYNILDTMYVSQNSPDTIFVDDPIKAALKIVNNEGKALSLSGGTSYNDVTLEINTATTGINIDGYVYNAINIHRTRGTAVYIDSTIDRDAEGIFINRTYNGISIQNCREAGLRIRKTNSAGIILEENNGNGIVVGNANEYGIYLGSCNKDGIHMDNSHQNGLFVNSCNWDGVNVNTTDSLGEYGVYTPDKIYGSNLTSRSFNTICKYIGNEDIETGDLVSIAGGYQINVLNEDENIPIINVRKVKEGRDTAIIGVVEYAVKIENRVEESKNKQQIIAKSFRYKSKEVYKNDYVSIVVFGPADVKINSKENIKVGDALTSHNGNVEKIKTTKINGITIAENTNIIGKALENSNGKDLLKVFVNCK